MQIKKNIPGYADLPIGLMQVRSTSTARIALGAQHGACRIYLRCSVFQPFFWCAPPTRMCIGANKPSFKAHLPLQCCRVDADPRSLQASVGGTVIEEWMSTSALEVCLPANESVSHAKCAAGLQQNSELYYKMVDPLAPSSLTGALWYQGESPSPPLSTNPHPLNTHANVLWSRAF